jgi:hypothetical protein
VEDNAEDGKEGESFFLPRLRRTWRRSAPGPETIRFGGWTSPVQGFCDSFGSSVLQNSVGLQLFPGHPIWKADVFSSEAYQAFAAQVAAASEAGKEPEDLQIMKVLPILLR